MIHKFFVPKVIPRVLPYPSKYWRWWDQQCKLLQPPVRLPLTFISYQYTHSVPEGRHSTYCITPQTGLNSPWQRSQKVQQNFAATWHTSNGTAGVLTANSELYTNKMVTGDNQQVQYRINEKPLSLKTRTSSILPNSENVSRISWSVQKLQINVMKL